MVRRTSADCVEWSTVTSAVAPVREPAHLPAPLRIDRLRVAYGPTVAVAEVSLSVAAGRVHALLGPNGAGKSTTISAAVGMLTPTSGTVRVFGADPQAAHSFTAGLTGVMLQDGGLPMASKPLAALRHLAQLYAEPAPIDELAERLGITSFANRPIRRLSGGQRQRVALAAALIGRPRLVFLDEPTAGLDPQAALAVRDVIAELRADGVAVVLTTHDMVDAQDLADEVTIIDHGRVIAAGTVPELIRSAAPTTGSALRITLRHEPDSALLDALADIGPVAAEGTDLEVRAEFDPQRLAQAAQLLADANVPVAGFSLSQRTLGDVFLDLTGRSLR